MPLNLVSFTWSLGWRAIPHDDRAKIQPVIPGQIKETRLRHSYLSSLFVFSGLVKRASTSRHLLLLPSSVSCSPSDKKRTQQGGMVFDRLVQSMMFEILSMNSVARAPKASDRLFCRKTSGEVTAAPRNHGATSQKSRTTRGWPEACLCGKV